MISKFKRYNKYLFYII